ncbi:zf-C3HC-domain-containing protein [Pseudovirgaria hyperparasitica]|uniref:Zf-C3HC-domain-containing protein n=1 Tax=Pseudovirgaria hyperparasitica TaxID=470096 RepID=A0A6A6WBQ1_9PEZI|nr:zf-C3HC-domain-containing protein [Pseudovirgaria hyperparasitica]KAF2760278.1 zf-C3HC-domain-containing protein [Pseudovirgaria hyperparasitica]
MVALNTTKRKFAKLLDNLTSSSHESTTSSSERNVLSATSVMRTEPPTKRSRLSDVAAANTHDLPSTPSSVSSRASLTRTQLYTLRTQERQQNTPSSIKLIKAGAAAQVSPGAARKPPYYAPWSQEQFLARLKTFADVKLWTSKPDRISEMEWAKRGWILDGWNTVACRGGCEQRLSIRLRLKRKDSEGREIDQTEDELLDVEDELVDRYEELLVTAHTETCLWRKSGCKGDIYHIPLARRGICEQALKLRYNSLLTIAASLPPLDSLCLPTDDLPAVLIDILPQSFFTTIDKSDTSEPPSPTPNLPALTLALHGWTGTTQETLPLLLCDHCFQRVGLWMYTTERMQEMSKSLDIPLSHLRLKVAETHREHCPWRSGTTQHNPSVGQLAGLSAWETVLSTLKRTTRSGDRRSSVESRPQTPIGKGISGDGPDGEDNEVLEEVYLTTAELEKLDRERTNKWQKLRARMSFRRRKSLSGRDVGGKSTGTPSMKSRPETPAPTSTQVDGRNSVPGTPTPA